MKTRMGEDSAIVGTMNRVQVTVKGDNTFSAEDAGVPIEGEASDDGKTLHLKPHTVLGRNAEKPDILLHANPDGTATYAGEGGDEHIVLHRTTAQPQP